MRISNSKLAKFNSELYLRLGHVKLSGFSTVCLLSFAVTLVLSLLSLSIDSFFPLVGYYFSIPGTFDDALNPLVNVHVYGMNLLKPEVLSVPGFSVAFTPIS